MVNLIHKKYGATMQIMVFSHIYQMMVGKPKFRNTII